MLSLLCFLYLSMLFSYLTFYLSCFFPLIYHSLHLVLSWFCPSFLSSFKFYPSSFPSPIFSSFIPLHPLLSCYLLSYLLSFYLYIIHSIPFIFFFFPFQSVLPLHLSFIFLLLPCVLPSVSLPLHNPLFPFSPYLSLFLPTSLLQTQETRTVTQFHFLTWPETGVPPSPKSLLEFRRLVPKQTNSALPTLQPYYILQLPFH